MTEVHLTHKSACNDVHW